MKTKKISGDVVRAISFLIIFIFLFCTIDRLLVGKDYPHGNNFGDNFSPYLLAMKQDGFYDLDKNTVDVVFMGSSHIHCCVNPIKIWDEYGYTSYDFSADQQDMATAYYYAKEIFKTQHPQVIAVETDWVPDNVTNLQGHFSFDFMKPNLDKAEGVMDRALDEDKLAFLTSYPDYHTRWKEIDEDDFKYLTRSKEHVLNGFAGNCYEAAQVAPVDDNTTTTELPEIWIKYMKKFYELCNEHNCQLMFIKTPSAIANQYTPLVNAVKDYVSNQRLNIPVIDYSFDERCGIDWSTDYSDIVHANYKGADKFSKVLGDDIRQMITIPEYSSDIKEKYNRKSSLYHRYIQNYEFTKAHLADDLATYVNAAKSDPDYVTILVGKNEPGLALNYQGYQSDAGNMWSYIEVIENGESIYKEQNTIDIRYDGTLDGKHLTVTSKTGVFGSNDVLSSASIVRDYDEEICNNDRGMNVIVFDLKIHKVIEKRSFDFYILQTQ